MAHITKGLVWALGSRRVWEEFVLSSSSLGMLPVVRCMPQASLVKPQTLHPETKQCKCVQVELWTEGPQKNDSNGAHTLNESPRLT